MEEKPKDFIRLEHEEPNKKDSINWRAVIFVIIVASPVIIAFAFALINRKPETPRCYVNEGCHYTYDYNLWEFYERK